MRNNNIYTNFLSVKKKENFILNVKKKSFTHFQINMLCHELHENPIIELINLMFNIYIYKKRKKIRVLLKSNGQM